MPAVFALLWPSVLIFVPANVDMLEWQALQLSVFVPVIGTWFTEPFPESATVPSVIIG
jgi:hypothetical protein